MSKPPTIDRKTLKTPDAFVSRGTQLLSSLSKSRVGLIPVLALGVLIALAFYGYDVWDENREQKAWAGYYEASKDSSDQKWERLKKVQQDWPRSRAAMLAAVEVADHHFENARKEWGKDTAKVETESGLAVQNYLKALEFGKLTPIEKQLLYINQGNAEELRQKFSESLVSYEKAYSLSAGAKGLALLGIGRIQEAQGNKEKSIETFEKVSTEFPASEFAKVAKMNWRRLKSPLLNARNSK